LLIFLSQGYSYTKEPLEGSNEGRIFHYGNAPESMRNYRAFLRPELVMDPNEYLFDRPPPKLEKYVEDLGEYGCDY